MNAARALALVLGLVLAASGAEAVEVTEVTTPLGIKAWLVEDKSTPVVSLALSSSSSSQTPGTRGRSGSSKRSRRAA